MSSPVPKSPENDKSRKYDRQIRLWGEHGQNVLEGATVCLANATAVGCEALKSLVLPSVGGFTIADGSVVTEDDLGINFFLDGTQIGQSKAQACMKMLQELNPDVTGDYVDESVDYILANRPQFFNSFDVVIATNLNESTLLELSKRLWDSNVPLIYCRSLGFFGTIRLQLREHCIIEKHPDNRQYDLRLEHPFAPLKQVLEDTAVTSKVPWPHILYKHLQVWREQHKKFLPKKYNEKTELRELIRLAMTKNEENHEEAISAVNTAFGGGSVPKNLEDIFADDACTNLHRLSKPFWFLVKALKDFVQNDNGGLLPLPGVLPDMAADTAAYINLQNVYRQQALQDAAAVYRKCQAQLRELGLPEDDDDAISEVVVRRFCREAVGLTVLRGTKIAEEYEQGAARIGDELEVQGTLTELYLALRAYERFLTTNGNIPGECYVENDTSRLKSVANKMLGTTAAAISDDMIHEICRVGGAEIHSISAFIGGCVAQEAIKVITQQYTPINNTFIYNGITSETTTLKL